MSCIASDCTQNLTLDPYKRVCYSQGLVLGVDEFVQEELYFLEQDRGHNRALHGYGTCCGLDVTVRDTAGDGPEIVVSPGIAVDPKGRRIRVTPAQCARLNEWLRRFGEDLGSPLGASSPASITLYLHLCYRECATDREPIPSGPCRSSDETSVPSRVLDAFTLKLETMPPDQTEADTVREFGRLLRQLQFSDTAPPTLTREDLENLVRSLLPMTSPALSPPLPPPPSGSPSTAWRIATADAEEFLRAAFRVWVTEVRPHLLPNGGACAGGPPQEDCILLARLDLPVIEGPAGLMVSGAADAVTIDQTNRPYLLHTQLIQELFLGGGFVAGQYNDVDDHGALLGLADDDHPQYLLVDPTTRALVANLDADGNNIVGLANGANAGDAIPIGQPAQEDLSGTYPGPTVIRVQGRDVLDQDPANNDVLTWVGGNNRWEPRAPAGGGVTDHGALTGLTDDDHPQYLLVNPANRALVADLNAAGRRVTSLANGAANGDAMPMGQPAQQDLSGTYPGPRVARLQGRDVRDQNPNNNDVLTWVGAASRWEPRPVPTPPAPPANAEPDLVRIFALSWRHNLPHDFFFVLDGKEMRGVAVAFGRKEAADANVLVGVVDDGGTRLFDGGSLDEQSFQVFVESGGPLITRQRVRPELIVPIKPNVAPGATMFVEGTEVTGPFPPGTPAFAPGALFVFDPAVLANLENARVSIELRGDHIVEEGENRRAIDAEFVRSELPTGDRPRPSEVGVQGGHFKSWIGNREKRGTAGRIDVNSVTFTSLTRIPGITAQMARDILVLRNSTEGGITNIDDLDAVSGVGPATLTRLRNALEVVR